MERILKSMEAFLQDTRGQLSLGTFMAIIIVIIVFSAMTPVLNYFVNYAVLTLGAGSVAATIVDLYPMGIAVALLWGIFIYSRPYAERYMGA